MADTLHRNLPLDMVLREALAWIGTAARADGNAEAAHLCRALANQVGETKVEYHVPAVHILCQAIGFYRENGQTDIAACIERIIQSLKRGAPRQIVGTLHFNAVSPGQLHDALESIAKRAGV